MTYQGLGNATKNEILEDFAVFNSGRSILRAVYISPSSEYCSSMNPYRTSPVKVSSHSRNKISVASTEFSSTNDGAFPCFPDVWMVFTDTSYKNQVARRIVIRWPLIQPKARTTEIGRFNSQRTGETGVSEYLSMDVAFACVLPRFVKYK